MPSDNATAIVQPIRVPEVNGQIQDLLTTSYTWLVQHWAQVLIAVAVATVLAGVLLFLRKLGHRLCSNSPGPAGWGTVFGRAITKTGNFFIIMVAAKLVDGYAGPPPQLAMTINFLFTVAAVFQSAIWAREIILGAVEQRTRPDEFAGEAIGSAMGIIRLLVTFALFAIALVVVLDNLGVNVTGLVAGLGVGGIAIGLAAQGIFADLFAALAIIFDRPFRRGDTINYGTITGTVEQIGLKSTRVRASTGEERIISNKNLLDKEIQNITRRYYRRGKFTLLVLYETQPDLIERIPAMLKEIVEGCGLRFVHGGLVNFGTVGLEFDVEFDSESPAFDPFYQGRHAVGVAILRRFREAGIAFADPILANTPTKAT